MKDGKGNEFYLLLLFVGMNMVLGGVDVLHYLLAAVPEPFHTHATATQISLLVFCGICYLSERMGLFRLNLRLYLLSLCLVMMKVSFEVQRTGWTSHPWHRFVVPSLLVLILIAFLRHPIRVMEESAASLYS